MTLFDIPVGLDQIIYTFGRLDDPLFEQRNIISFDLPFPMLYAGKPVKTARCHRLAAGNFIEALLAVERAGLAESLAEFNGIYCRRSIRGQPAHPSTHSWGIAGDWCASQFPLGSNHRMSETIIKCFRDAGFFYGGDFKSRRDGMHFQLCRGY